MLHEQLTIQIPGSLYEGRLYTYFLGNCEESRPQKKRPVVVVCPGGGYEKTSDSEAEPVAMQFLAMGCHAVILRYSVAPARYPEALLQLAQTVRILRENTEKWYIDSHQIILQGSSAGGHLAACLGVSWEHPFLSERLKTASKMIQPNGLILSYPVITSGEKAHKGSFENLLGNDYKNEEKLRSVSLELCVTKSAPRTFLWHTATDPKVPVENSLLFFQALHRVGIPAELHIYPLGGHGLSLANEETSPPDGSGIQLECQSWIALVDKWLGHI